MKCKNRFAEDQTRNFIEYKLRLQWENWNYKEFKTTIILTKFLQHFIKLILFTNELKSSTIYSKGKGEGWGASEVPGRSDIIPWIICVSSNLYKPLDQMVWCGTANESSPFWWCWQSVCLFSLWHVRRIQWWGNDVFPPIKLCHMSMWLNHTQHSLWHSLSTWGTF